MSRVQIRRKKQCGPRLHRRPFSAGMDQVKLAKSSDVGVSNGADEIGKHEKARGNKGNQRDG